MNESGEICPKCKSVIGTRLMWPDGGIKCPHCRQKLKYNPAGVGLFSILMFIYLGIITLALFLTSDLLIPRMSTRVYMLFWMGIGLVMWIPFGLFAGYRLKMKSKLELKN